MGRRRIVVVGMGQGAGRSTGPTAGPTDLTQPRWLGDGEQVSWRAYLQGSRMLEEALDRDLQEHGLQLSEYEILSMLSESAGQRLRMSELASLVVQSRSRLTHTAARLEKRGWVERQSCLSDKRGVELVLTPEGRRRLEETAKAHVESVRRHLLDVMSPAQFEALGTAMASVRDAALGQHQEYAAAECAAAERATDGSDRRPQPVPARA